MITKDTNLNFEMFDNILEGKKLNINGLFLGLKFFEPGSTT